jgi:hypothetical protein
MKTPPRILVGAAVVLLCGAVVTCMLDRGKAPLPPTHPAPKTDFAQGDRVRWVTDRFDRTYMVLYDGPTGGSDMYFRETVDDAKEFAKELSEEGNRNVRVFLITAVTDKPRR